MTLGVPFFFAAWGVLTAFTATAQGAAPLRLQQGDRVVFVGNTFAERLALFSYFEAVVMASYPGHELTFRNLGWSGDTLTLQPRPLNFGDMDTHLAEQKADVIIACFGMDESFAGPAGLRRFEQDWRDFLNRMKASKFNGKTAPRVAMVSPIAHERKGAPLPDPARHNENLRLYTEAMRKIAAASNLPFADLFVPTRRIMDQGAEPNLTINGIHLTQYGDWIVAQLLAQELGVIPRAVRPLVVDGAKQPVRFQLGSLVPLPPPPAATDSLPVDHRPIVVIQGLAPGTYVLRVGGEEVASGDAARWAQGIAIRRGAPPTQAEKLRQAIVEKNQQFFYRWRAVNGEYIYGRRKEPFGIVNFPREMKMLDGIVADRDGEIWGLAKALREQVYELARTGS